MGLKMTAHRRSLPFVMNLSSPRDPKRIAASLIVPLRSKRSLVGTVSATRPDQLPPPADDE
jgi:hypothetical protein